MAIVAEGLSEGLTRFDGRWLVTGDARRDG